MKTLARILIEIWFLKIPVKPRVGGLACWAGGKVSVEGLARGFSGA